jgi:hypothetical protein
VHAAVCDDRMLVLAADHEKGWTLLRDFWALEPLAGFLALKLERPLVLLPAVGVVRLDDAPGTAQHQVQDTDHPDARQVRRIKAMARAYGRHGAVLNMAVAARALAADGRTQVPLEDVWPRSVAAIADGVRDGTFEPVGHGYLHLDPDALARDEIEWREFGALDEREAGRRIDAVMVWQEQALGRRPDTFVAPAWAYSEGTRRAANARGLPAWLPPRLGPLTDGDDPHQTLDSALRTMDGLCYGPSWTWPGWACPPPPSCTAACSTCAWSNFARRATPWPSPGWCCAATC